MNIKTILSTLTIITIISRAVIGQDTDPSGKPLATIYADYKQQLNGENSFHGFNVTRAYFGYRYKIDSRLSAQIILDVGAPLATQDVTSKRYAYLKNAYISYKLEKVTIKAGLTDVRGSTLQNSYWAKKYLSQPFLLKYKYVNSADLGVVVDYKISDKISVDAAILNGEGYTNIQMDETLQFTGGVTITPVDGFAIRLYGDLYMLEAAASNTLAVFTGYRNEKFTVGIQYNYKTDSDMTDSHNIFGYSANASVKITPKADLFSRYDRSGSVVSDGDINPWNQAKDGSLLIGGLQYIYSGNFRISIDYQGWSPDNSSVERIDFIQVDCEFRF